MVKTDTQTYGTVKSMIHFFHYTPATSRVCCVSWVCDFSAYRSSTCADHTWTYGLKLCGFYGPLRSHMHACPYTYCWHYFDGHDFPGKPGLAGCCLDFQSPVIIILQGQAETLRTQDTWIVPHPPNIDSHPSVFWSSGFMGHMPFQHQSTEGTGIAYQT